MLSLALLLIAGPPVTLPPAAEPAPAPAEAAAVVAPAAPPPAVEVRGADARMRVLSGEVAVALKRLPGDHRVQTFAVTRLEEAGTQAKQRQLGLVLSDMVVTNLARQHNLTLVERTALGKIMEEQALGQTGAIDEKQAAQVGKLAGARALVVGTVSDGGDGFRVSIRTVDAETAAVLSTHETVLPADELIAYAEDAVVLRSRSGALFRSMVLPGWGQLYNDEPVKAAALGGLTGVLAFSAAGTLGAGFYLNYIRYPNLGQDDEKDPAKLAALTKGTRESGNNALTIGGVLLGATALAWGITAVDAWLSGHDVANADAALAQR